MMAAKASSRTLTFALFCIFPCLFGQENNIPDVTILPLKPRGIRITAPNNPKLSFFAFQGRINNPIGDDDVGEISGDVMKAKDDYWTYQDDSVSLKVGDIIYYYAVAIKSRKEHRVKGRYIVEELFDLSQPSRPQPTPAPASTSIPIIPSTTDTCRRTITQILSPAPGFSSTPCASKIIFEDNFDTLRGDFWTIEHYIPSKPEYPFVSYQRLTSNPTVFVDNGILHIEPKLQETLPGFDNQAITSSKLDLSVGCTRVGFCEFTSSGSQILPPIASGRITNKFSFKYGIVEIRAKVPQGDWLYPDILLESLSKRFGTENYASGVVRIAGVLGNMGLSMGELEYGNKVLYGGPMMEFNCRTQLLSKKVAATEWGNDFHVYSLRWGPDMITLSVDGVEWGRTEPPASGLHVRLPRDKCHPPRDFLGTPMAPFDDYFTLTLGVAAGGISEFPDHLMSQFILKPWVNSARRARIDFLNAKDSWLNTWTQPALLVDYVKVYAL